MHAVRDGRDSGSSKVRAREKATTRPDAASGIDFWATAEAGRGGGARPGPRGPRAPPRVGLDELVWGDREGTYGGLLDFLGVADEPAMRGFFDREMTADAAHRERWREGLGGGRAEGGQRRGTRRRSTRLEREGYHCAAVLRRSYERTLAAQTERLTLAERRRGRSSSAAPRRQRVEPGRRPPRRPPGLAAVPVAARFHTDKRGMPALLGGQVGAGRTSSGRFRERWWHGASTASSGPRSCCPRQLDAASWSASGSAYHRDPVGACRGCSRLLGGPPRRARPGSWR